MEKTGYTAWNDASVDRYVHGQLDLIVQRVCALFGSRVRAIVLTGGFGRGEGSVLRRGDGTLRVINDYDVDVVLGGRVNAAFGGFISKLRFRRPIQRLARNLAIELGIKQIDIGLRNAVIIPETEEVRLVDFDLRHGHRLLYGETDPLSALPDYRADQIAKFEATWLLRNRGIGLLLARLYLGEYGRLADENRENFYIEINKAFLAAGDALFILRGRYVCSYAQRAFRIEELVADDIGAMAGLRDVYRRAAEYKLRPIEGMYPGIPPAALWRMARDRLVDVLLYVESQRLGRAFPGITEYSDWVRKQPRLRTAQRLKLLLRRWSGDLAGTRPTVSSLGMDRARSVLFTLALLAWEAERAADNRVAEGIVEELVGERVPTWVRWRSLASEFLLLVHPGGEVGRFLKTDEGGEP